jgi:glucose-6-phosphate dehydrogenase assembly protein OpcA
MATHLVRAGRVTDLDGIFAALQRSDEEASEEFGTGPCVTTLNLIVYVDDPAYREWVLERAGNMAEKHPSRLIVLDATRDDEKADVLVGGERDSGCTVLHQRIELAAGGIDPAVLGGLVRALSMRDTHSVLWWSSATAKDVPVLDALLPSVATMVIDSSGPGRGEEAMRDVAAFLASHRGTVVRDLAYMRLLPWQDMIAQFFDDRDLFDDLFGLRRLAIEAGSVAETLYLAGWLGSRLSWSVRDRHTFVARDGTPVVLVETPKGERRRVVRVILESDASTYAATLSDDAGVVCLSVEGAKAKPCWYTPLRSIDTMSLVERATMTSGPDHIFETTVETVCALLDCA